MREPWHIVCSVMQPIGIGYSGYTSAGIGAVTHKSTTIGSPKTIMDAKVCDVELERQRIPKP